MKKKKLKKKIKKLKSDIKWLKGCQRNLALRENNNANKIKNLSDAYTNRFNKFNQMNCSEVDTLRVKKDGTGDVYEIPCKKVSKGEDDGIDVK